jgi:hypothetical protein
VRVRDGGDAHDPVVRRATRRLRSSRS